MCKFAGVSLRACEFVFTLCNVLQGENPNEVVAAGAV